MERYHQCRQCFGSKPTNLERGLWYTYHYNNHGGTKSSTQYIDTIAWWRPAARSKRCDQYQSDNRETNDKTKPFITIVLLILEQIAWFPKEKSLFSLWAFPTFRSFARNYSKLLKRFLSKLFHRLYFGCLRLLSTQQENCASEAFLIAWCRTCMHYI